MGLSFIFNYSIFRGFDFLFTIPLLSTTRDFQAPQRVMMTKGLYEESEVDTCFPEFRMRRRAVLLPQPKTFIACAHPKTVFCTAS